jgi:tryptophan-rich hypothetical protein
MLCSRRLTQEVWELKPLNKPANTQINAAKLLLSKWTAVVPQNKEKHFLVTTVNEDDLGQVMTCTLEAVLTKQAYKINWHDLKDSQRWLVGWH